MADHCVIHYISGTPLVVSPIVSRGVMHGRLSDKHAQFCLHKFGWLDRYQYKTMFLCLYWGILCPITSTDTPLERHWITQISL